MCEVELRRDGGIEGEDSNALLLCSQASFRVGNMEIVRFGSAAKQRRRHTTSPSKTLLPVRA